MLLSFLFAFCIDISVEDRGDFIGDSVLSLTFCGCPLYYLIIYIILSSSFPSLCSHVIGQLISLFGLSICLLVLVRCLLSGVASSVGLVHLLSFCFRWPRLLILSCCCLRCLPLCLLFCYCIFLVDLFGLFFTYVHLYSKDPTALGAEGLVAYYICC